MIAATGPTTRVVRPGAVLIPTRFWLQQGSAYHFAETAPDFSIKKLFNVVTLGAFYSKPAANGSMQTASALYYASGGYYAGVTLHQLWPVEVEGKPATLVWRGDMISSASVGSLRGIERIAAESTMIKDISRAVSLFRRDSGGSR